MPTIQKDRILEFRGQDLCDGDGDKIGTIEEIYLDAQTNEPEWALIHTGLFGTKRTFVPLGEATERDGSLCVGFEKDTVKNAPKVEANGQLSQSEENELYRHYGMDYADSDSATAGRASTDTDLDGDIDRDDDVRGTVGHDTSGPTTDEAMTRSEEELRVGTAEREAGTARLRKYVVTEDVQKTVPVKREEVRREEIDMDVDTRGSADLDSDTRRDERL